MSRFWSAGFVAAVAALAVAGAASAASPFLVGVADDSGKWARPGPVNVAAAALGLDAVRITLHWQPGEEQPSAGARDELARAFAASGTARVVVAVYGRPTDVPQTDAARAAYCSYLGTIVSHYRQVRDIVVWNEPNSSAFWRPQFDAQGRSVAPAAYEALLARCWDTLRAIRGDVNVIAASAPRGNDRPAAPNGDHSPGTWYRELGRAYRASGRTRPIFDTVGHNPYPDFSGEHPSASHPRSSSIDLGDYGKLLAALSEGFAGTGQALPGQGNVSIWYLEYGLQTGIDPVKAALYTGTENERSVLDPATHGERLATALRLAYCQPAVGAFFNFELADERGLDGWQSGLLWADGTPKPAFEPFRRAVADARNGRVDCSQFGLPAPQRPVRPAAAPPATPAAPPPATPQAPRGGSTGTVVLTIHGG